MGRTGRQRVIQERHRLGADWELRHGIAERLAHDGRGAGRRREQEHYYFVMTSLRSHGASNPCLFVDLPHGGGASKSKAKAAKAKDEVLCDATAVAPPSSRQSQGCRGLPWHASDSRSGPRSWGLPSSDTPHAPSPAAAEDVLTPVVSGQRMPKVSRTVSPGSSLTPCVRSHRVGMGSIRRELPSVARSWPTRSSWMLAPREQKRRSQMMAFANEPPPAVRGNDFGVSA